MDTKHISTSLNKFCAILSNIIKADFLIADYNLRKIASTYSDASEEGQSKITVSSIITNVVKTGKPVILSKTQENPGCNVCSERLTCSVSGFIGVPVKHGEQILGAMAMIAPITRSINMFGTLQNAVDTLEKAAQIVAMILSGEFASEPASEEQISLDFLTGIGIATVDRDGMLLSKRGASSELFPDGTETVGELLPLAMPLSRTTVQAFFYASLDPDGFFGHVTWVPGYAGGSDSLLILRSHERPISSSARVILQECQAPPFRHLPPYRALLDHAARLSCSQLPVLLSGSQGSGKGILASYIHANSSRGGKPLLFIDCQSLPPLSQAEAVFGDATAPETGLLWQASYGTVCFQNIEFMSYALQNKLSNIIECKLPLKSPSLCGHFDLRLLFSTCLPLQDLQAAGLLTDRFLGILQDHVLEIPELSSDSPAFFPVFESILDAYFEKRHCNRLALSEELKQAIRRRRWTRLDDLYRIAEMIVNSVEQHTLRLSDVPILQRDGLRPEPSAKDEEDEQILLLIKQGISKTEIAKRFCISRATLYRRLKNMSSSPSTF
ncbi:MAG: sigma 54-interacting transcriptional regulator [Oscillibacter sp.]|uniref:sigma 54-interacting transcriptional regulator n=1 Tax=Oscillibacter sp. TaxID=1945593 RepID=UPI002173128E|nr:sigma 54-interacting transcriptional regulator [Oscillibacter sp.]MCI9113709.1 sigma 54-interacting transcriptional regulator [Oscillibacter sp.]